MPKVAKGVSESSKKISQDRKKSGGSNIGKYTNVKPSDFAGPQGGAPKGSYPINTEKRARAALAYAHNAPHPSGIRKAVRKKYPDLSKKTK